MFVNLKLQEKYLPESNGLMYIDEENVSNAIESKRQTAAPLVQNDHRL